MFVESALGRWRSIKYEEVCLKAYQTVPEARTSIGAYRGFYNEERPHQALGYRTPREVIKAGGLNTKTSSPEDLEGEWITNEQAGISLNSGPIPV